MTAGTLLNRYVGPEERLVTGRRAILRNYARRWLTLDLIASFPFDWCVYSGFPPLEPSGAAALDAPLDQRHTHRLFKVLKLVKLLRLGNHICNHICNHVCNHVCNHIFHRRQAASPASCHTLSRTPRASRRTCCG